MKEKVAALSRAMFRSLVSLLIGGAGYALTLRGSCYTS